MEPAAVLLLGEWLLAGILLCFFGLRIQGTVAERMALLRLSRDAALIGRDYSLQGLGLLVFGILILLGLASTFLPKPFSDVGAFSLLFAIPLFVLGYGFFLYRRVVLPAT